MDGIIARTGPSPIPPSFALHLEAARFSQRTAKIMGSCIEESRGVSPHVVAQLEEEFFKLQRMLYPNNDGKFFFLW
jgi:hypothetical protein